MEPQFPGPQGEPLRRTSKLLTVEGLLEQEKQAGSDSKKLTFEKTPTIEELEKEKAFYEKAREYFQMNKVKNTEGLAQTGIVDEFEKIFGKGFTKIDRVKTFDGKDDYVHAVRINFQKLRETFYPHIDPAEEEQKALEITNEEELGQTG